MTIKLKLIHHYRDLVDSWDENPFRDVQEAQIDETIHTIKNVCVFGTRHSRNGYDYEDAAINRLAILAEGAKFFINHPSKSEAKDRDGVRDIRDWAGVYSAPRKEGADKIYADLKVRPAFWSLVKDVAIMKPPGIGNSINSRVKIFKDQVGKEYVVDIDVLKSIDLVASAATTQNLFESHKEGEVDVNEVIEQILSEKGKVQEDMTFQLVRDMLEGLLVDKIKEREKERKIRDLQWKVEEAIADTLKDKEKDMKSKKVDIAKILEDFEGMINDILAGKKVLAIENKKEEDDMEFGKLTLEDLTKERPDIIKAIKDSMKMGDEMASIKKEHGEMKTKIEAVTKEMDNLKTQLEAVTKERDEYKKKIDEFEAKQKGAKKEALITVKAAELKLPKELMTDVFKTTLMGMEDKEIEEAIKDRKEVFLKGQKVVRNAGDEYVPITESETTDEIQKKKEKVTASLKASVGR